MSSSDSTSEALRDAQVRETLNQKLIETGQKEKLQAYLRERLYEVGWRDKLKERCKDVIRSKGVQRISVDDLVKEILPFGRGTVPDEVKQDLLGRLKKFLSQHST